MYAHAEKSFVTMSFSSFDIGYDAFYRRHSYFENNARMEFATTNVLQNKPAEGTPAQRLRVMDIAFLLSSNTECSTEISRCETPPTHVQSATCGLPDPPTSTDRSIHTYGNLEEDGTEDVTGALEAQKTIGDNDTGKIYKPSSSGYLHGVPVRIKTTNTLQGDVPRSAKRQAPRKYLLASRHRMAGPDFETLEKIFEKIEKVPSHGQTIIYSCPLCPSEHATKTSFEEHMKLHLAQRTYDCHLCLRQFKLEQNLKNHILWHSKLSLKCHVCHKVLTSVAGHKMHMESHSGITYECTICNRELLSLSSFEGHMRIHAENKVYECPYCQKQLKYKLTLKIHMRLHTGEKPYECNICHMKMSTTQMLSNHMRKHR